MFNFLKNLFSSTSLKKTSLNGIISVSPNKDAFTLTATLENPSAGATQIFCSEAEECHPK
jgi:hypothetical protein